MKPTVYIDTTIPSYYFDEREEIRVLCEITRAWWRDEAQRYSLCTSEETLAELGQGEYPRQRQVIRFAAKVPLLEPHAAIPGIAQVYVEHRLMPQSLKGDALHLAYASFYKTDFLLTWNCDHLANANKRRHLRWLNTRLNLCIPEIVTPLELVTESSDEN